VPANESRCPVGSQDRLQRWPQWLPPRHLADRTRLSVFTRTSPGVMAEATLVEMVARSNLLTCRHPTRHSRSRFPPLPPRPPLLMRSLKVLQSQQVPPHCPVLISCLRNRITISRLWTNRSITDDNNLSPCSLIFWFSPAHWREIRFAARLSLSCIGELPRPAFGIPVTPSASSSLPPPPDATVPWTATELYASAKLPASFQHDGSSLSSPPSSLFSSATSSA